MKTTINILFLLFLMAHGLQAVTPVVKDDFWKYPQRTYNERKQLFLDFTVTNGTKTGMMAVFNQIVRSEKGMPVEENYVSESINLIYYNHDCNDFAANGLIRLMYLDKEKQLLSPALRIASMNCLIDFKYWWDDGRKDTTYRCYHTENHQALYHTAELLAGQLYKDKVFTNGMTGKEHVLHAEKLLGPWLEHRFMFGFSEWFSVGYYDVEIMLLTNLYDFAENPVIKNRARMLLDLLLFDVALNNYHGTFGATHGRVYVSTLLGAQEGTSPTTKLLFGIGEFLPENYMGTSCLVSSSYRCPEVIQQVAVDDSKPMDNHQKIGINVEDAGLYGLKYDNETDCQFFWGMQEFIHPKVVRMSAKMSEKYDTWPYKNYSHYISLYDDQIKQYGKVVTPQLDRFALSEANIETYRTPDYMLSSVTDYRPGAAGYQQHIWQATFDNEAIVFTTHPGDKHYKMSPNYWAGNSVMPRAAQHKNVLIAIYNTPDNEKNAFTHAYFPKDKFDEVVINKSWTFARKGKGYIALYSQQLTNWLPDEKGVLNDLIAQGRRNCWISEMGSEMQWGSFKNFIIAILASEVSCENQTVKYHSPSIGTIGFGWNTSLKVNDKIIPLRNKLRFDNRYCKSPFAAKTIVIKKGNHKLELDFNKVSRVNR